MVEVCKRSRLEDLEGYGYGKGVGDEMVWVSGGLRLDVGKVGWKGGVDRGG